MIELKRPLVFCDVESTGLDREKDRIVSICLCKLTSLDLSQQETYTSLVNPKRPIPPSSTAIHGLKDADVAEAPDFWGIAREVYTFIDGCDIAGYGSNYFDVPILFYELERSGIFWDTSAINLVDVCNLYKIMESRHLSNALKFYCDRSHTTAHTALGDTLATMDVFLAQLKRYEYDLPQSIDGLDLFTNYGHLRADISGKFIYSKNGVLCFNFGPHKGQPAKNHFSYLEWMYYQADFPSDTNAILKSILEPSEQDSDDLDFQAS